MDEFREAMQSKDVDRVMELVADDVVFRSPVVYAPYQGRETVRPMIAAALSVFEDVRYVRQIGDGDSRDRALVLEARVGDREVEACDFLHLNEDGLIDELYVMVRPLSGAMAVSEAIGRQMAAGAAPAA